MAEDSNPKPAVPAGDAPQPALPAPSDPVQTTHTSSTTAAASQPAASATNGVNQTEMPQHSSGSSDNNSLLPPRPESSVIQNGEQQVGLNTTTQQLQQAPVLPEKTYPRDPRWLTYGALPAALPSQVLPRFFKLLAVVIFITGTSATLLTLIYQRLVFPKLLLTRARLASLHQHQVSLYDKLLLSAHSLVYSNDSLYPASQRRIAQISAPDPTLPAGAQEDIAKTESVSPEKTISESDEEEPLFADESPLEKSDELEVQPVVGGNITSKLHVSLGKLQAALQQHRSIQKPTQVAVEDEDEEYSLNNQTQSQKTMKSLEELSTFLTNEAFYASTPAFSGASYGWNFGGSSSIPQRSGMDREKIAQVKNEIRSLKGMLLTRRNFAIPKQEIST